MTKIPNIKIQYAWESLEHFKLFDKHHGECIPINSFSSDKDIDEFINALKKHNLNER